MPARIAVPCLLMLAIVPAPADNLLCRYEGGALPQDETPGWQNGDPCDAPCQETVENGFLVHHWPTPGNRVGYYYWLARPPVPAPQRLWVEWAFRSNHAIGRYFYTCDGWFSIQYASMQDTVYMYGDAAISFEGGDYILGLDVNEFHTYRFESLNGFDYRISIDGLVFISDSQNQPNVSSILHFGGYGGCIGDSFPDLVNEWDFVRFGTISYGERIVASAPPAGFIDARQHPSLDRFAITFDSPNYVYLDEITVEVIPAAPQPFNQYRDREGAVLEFDGGTEAQSYAGMKERESGSISFCIPHSPFNVRASPFDIPIVVATRRLDNGPSDVVEIVLDRPIPYNATTRFNFNDGTLSQSLDFTFAPGDADGDGRAALSDFAYFQNCFGRFAQGDPSTSIANRQSAIDDLCALFDFNSDISLDLADFHALQSVLAGP